MSDATTDPENLTPSQRTARLRTQMRAQAATLGRPMDRLTRPGLYLSASVGHVVYVDNGTLTYVEIDHDSTVENVHHGAPRPVTIEALIDMCEMAYRPYPTTQMVLNVGRWSQSAHTDPFRTISDESWTVPLFADATAFKMARAMVSKARRKNSDSLHGRISASVFGHINGLSRTFDYRAGLPHSAFLPVLTDSLVMRYYPQTGTNEASVASWASAFGYTGSFIEQVARLTDAACEGSHIKISQNMIAAEAYGTASARSTSALSTSKAFKQSQGVSECWSSLLASDPKLIEHNMITGDAGLVTFLPSKFNGSRSVAQVPDGFKLKPGQVLVSNPNKPGVEPVTARIESIRFDESTNRMLVSMRSTGDRRDYIESAARGGASLILSSSPFLSFGKSSVTGKWAAKNEVKRPVGREIPVDVLLAGAPAEN